VDPLDQAADIFSVIHWASGRSDGGQESHRPVGNQLLRWAGGLDVAARDPRVKALVSQVAIWACRSQRCPRANLAKSYDDGTRRARQLDYPPPRARRWTPPRWSDPRKILLYAPIEDAPAPLRGVRCSSSPPKRGAVRQQEPS
jgi:hypothetical protein